MDNGFKRLDRWMIDKDDAVLRGGSCFASLFSRAGSKVQTPQDCLKGKTMTIKIRLGFIPWRISFCLLLDWQHKGRCFAGYGVLFCFT